MFNALLKHPVSFSYCGQIGNLTVAFCLTDQKIDFCKIRKDLGDINKAQF